MLINHEYSVEFLTSKIGPYVETNPVTGMPRLIKGLNEVWQAIEEFGGISFTAKFFSIPEAHIQLWIDNHNVPRVFAQEVAKKLGCKVNDFKIPSAGYDDPVNGLCWPQSWLMS